MRYGPPLQNLHFNNKLNQKWIILNSRGYGNTPLCKFGFSSSVVLTASFACFIESKWTSLGTFLSHLLDIVLPIYPFHIQGMHMQKHFVFPWFSFQTKFAKVLTGIGRITLSLPRSPPIH